MAAPVDAEHSWPDEFRDLSTTAMTMFRVHLGDFNFDFEEAELKAEAKLMFGSFLVLVIVLLMNLLIAVLSTEHARVSEDIDKEFGFTQASTILRHQMRVKTHVLPPPLNLWVPASWRGASGGRGERKTRTCGEQGLALVFMNLSCYSSN